MKRPALSAMPWAIGQAEDMTWYVQAPEQEDGTPGLAVVGFPNRIAVQGFLIEFLVRMNLGQVQAALEKVNEMQAKGRVVVH